MIKHLIDIPIYKQSIEVRVGSLKNFLEEIYNKHNLTKSQLGIRDWSLIDGVTICIDETLYVWFSDTTATFSTIIHELWHIVSELASLIGLDTQDQEAICYLQEYIFEQLFGWLNTQPTVMDHFSPQLIAEDEAQ